MNFTGNKQLKYLLLLLVLTTLLYIPALKNNFNNWDDQFYFTTNPNIALNQENIKHSFLQAEYHNMYVPLTALSNSIVYHFFGLDPKPNILLNLIIHLCNIVLLFYFLSLLIKNPYVPTIAASLFALHPMQVESVAYAAGRRDVLYVLFYLACAIFYIISLNRKKHYLTHYFLSLFFALLAMLSKGQALTIPFTLILISLFKNEKWNSKKFWLDKIPFFIITVIFAYKVFSAPLYATGNFIGNSYIDTTIPIFSRLIYASYSFIQYIILLIVPYKLSLVHAYPIVGGKYIIPPLFYLYLIVFTSLIFFFFRYAIKEKKLWFGIVFFAINIFMLLQLVPNSFGIMNDHYVYFAGVGIFFIIGNKISDLLVIKKITKIIIAFLICYVAILGFVSYQRIQVFKDSTSLWNDVIKKYPQCFLAYNNRGSLFDKQELYDRAIDDYSKAIELNPDYAKAYNNRGFDYDNQHLYDKAIADYAKALEIDPNFTKAYNNLEIAFLKQGLYDRVISDYTKTIKINPANADAYNNRGIAFVNKKLYDKAIVDYTKAIALQPDYTDAYYNRGIAYFNQSLFDKAVDDYTKAISLKPNYADAYNNRGFTYINMGLNDLACSDFFYAKKLGSKVALNNLDKFCK